MSTPGTPPQQVTVTLTPAFYILMDVSGEYGYGPYDSVEDAEAIRPLLGNRVAASELALGVMKTAVQHRRGRLSNAAKAALAAANGQETAPAASKAPTKAPVKG
jgi:hypothetical protein